MLRKLLDKLIGRNDQYPYSQFVRRHLSVNGINFRFERIFLLAQSDDTSAESLQEIRTAIIQRNWGNLAQLKCGDVRNDLAQVYLLKGESERAMIIGILSPIELYVSEVTIGSALCSWNEVSSLAQNEVR